MSSPPKDRPYPPLSPLASRSPRVPAAAHLAPAGVRAEGRGGLHSPGRLRAALCSERLAPPVAGVSAAWRGLRAQFPGAERGATAARGGFLRCCPPPPPPPRGGGPGGAGGGPGAATMGGDKAPRPKKPPPGGLLGSLAFNLRVYRSTRCQIHAHVLRSPTCSLHAWV